MGITCYRAFWYQHWVQALTYQPLMVLVSHPLWIKTSSRVLLATVAGPAFSLLLDEAWIVTPRDWNTPWPSCTKAPTTFHNITIDRRYSKHSIMSQRNTWLGVMYWSKISRNQPPSSTPQDFFQHTRGSPWDTNGFTQGETAQDACGGGWDEAPGAAASFSRHKGHDELRLPGHRAGPTQCGGAPLKKSAIGRLKHYNGWHRYGKDGILAYKKQETWEVE